MARLTEAVIDAWHPYNLAKFWEQALDDYVIAPVPDDELEYLSSIGRTPETAPAVILDGPGFRLYFQEPERDMENQGHIHFDVVGDDRETEVQRLVMLGATVKEIFEHWTKMKDPEGNEFCVLG